MLRGEFHPDASSANSGACLQSFHSPQTYHHPLLSPTYALHVRVAPFHNDVGLRVWEAGYFLAEFLLKNPDLVEGRRVLELGAGCGLTGLVCASLRCKSVHMTDYTPPSIANLKHNVVCNCDFLGSNKDKVTVGFLDWTDYSAAPPVDTLIAADVVYDVQFIPHLVSCTRQLLEGGTTSKVRACNSLSDELSEHVFGLLTDCDGTSCDSPPSSQMAIFATTFRNEKTFELYVAQLEKHGIKYEELKAQPIGAEYEVFDRFWKQKRDEVRIHKFTI